MTRRLVLPRDREAFHALFTAIRDSWFRLETLQAYGAGGEQLREFLAGRPRRPVPGVWEAMIRDHVAAGRSLRRVHLIREPPSGYIRWELFAYRSTIEAGEDVRVVPVPEGQSWPEGIPEGFDFWLFDDRDAWAMDYDDAGQLIAVELVTDPSSVEHCRAWRDAALAASIPAGDYSPERQGYVASHDVTERTP